MHIFILLCSHFHTALWHDQPHKGETTTGMNLMWWVWWIEAAENTLRRE